MEQLYTCWADNSDVSDELCQVKKRTSRIQRRIGRDIAFPQCLKCGSSEKYMRKELEIITFENQRAIKIEKECRNCKKIFLGASNKVFCRDCQIETERIRRNKNRKK